MPSLNQGRFIDAAIDSVLGQDYPHIELIVADGASIDDTPHRLARRARGDTRLRWLSEPDDGPAQALNRALARVRGTVIGWLNADDLYTPGAISRAVAALDEHRDWLMAYGHGEHVDIDGKVIDRYPTLPPHTPIEQFTEGCFICQPTMFFRRTATILLGRFDESLKTAFDFDYWLRAFSRFPDRIGFVDAVQAYSRLHTDCITLRQRRTVMLEGIRILARQFGHAPINWAETYVEELIAGRTSPSQDLRAEVLSFLELVLPDLMLEDWESLRNRIDLDTRLDPLDSQSPEESTIFQPDQNAV